MLRRVEQDLARVFLQFIRVDRVQRGGGELPDFRRLRFIAQNLFEHRRGLCVGGEQSQGFALGFVVRRPADDFTRRLISFRVRVVTEELQRFLGREQRFFCANPSFLRARTPSALSRSSGSGSLATLRKVAMYWPRTGAKSTTLKLAV
jgi:hypothetical protein